MIPGVSFLSGILTLSLLIILLSGLYVMVLYGKEFRKTSFLITHLQDLRRFALALFALTSVLAILSVIVVSSIHG